MAKINNFIYCLNSNTSETDANAIGVLNAITPDYVPGAFSFSILCSVVDIEEGTHDIGFRFINPDGDTIVNLTGKIPYERQKDVNLPKEYVGINVSSNWQNVVLKKSGLYSTVVSFDGKDIGSYTIFVKGRNEVG